MTHNVADPAPAPPFAGLAQIIKLASFAVGGQGGGVLNNWIVNLAERNGYVAQATSVAGVAQRTGATIYYVEMVPVSDKHPVLALSPSEDDVDIVLAAELMEAGRAAMRQFITAGKTHVIASTHRQLATLEKVVPGNGTSSSNDVITALRDHCDDLVAFDMQQIADEEGSVISAALFGALAGSGALPFDVESFRETVRESGRGVDQSLATFERAYAIAAGHAQITASDQAPPAVSGPVQPVGPAHLLKRWSDLENRLATLPDPARDMAAAGLAKVTGFQDLDYGADYLNRLDDLATLDRAAGGAANGFAFTTTAAKYLANAMAYDDIIHVADAKTNAGRFGRIQTELGAQESHLIRLTEYTHPGAAEIISLMPTALARRVQSRGWAVRGIDRLFNRGRRIRTDRIGGFLSLYIVAGLRRWRTRLLRHQAEMAHIDDWLAKSTTRLTDDYAQSVEILRMRRLIKGYSDTHARGMSKFDKVMNTAAVLNGRPDAADWTRRLTQAALQDADGIALDGAIKTVLSFAQTDKPTPATA